MTFQYLREFQSNELVIIEQLFGLNINDRPPLRMIDDAENVNAGIKGELFLPLQFLIVNLGKPFPSVAIKPKCQIANAATVLHHEQVSAVGKINLRRNETGGPNRDHQTLDVGCIRGRSRRRVGI